VGLLREILPWFSKKKKDEEERRGGIGKKEMSGHLGV